MKILDGYSMSIDVGDIVLDGIYDVMKSLVVYRWLFKTEIIQ